MKASELPEIKRKYDTLVAAVGDFEDILRKLCLGLIALESRIVGLEQNRRADEQTNAQINEHG